MNFSAWILTIVGVVFLTLVVDIILPDGETNKYIKSIFAIVTVLVIAAPIPTLVNADFDISDIFGSGSSALQIDEDYLLRVFEQKTALYERGLKEQLAAEGITGVEFSFTPDTENFAYSVGVVFVNMKNAAISGEAGADADEKIADLLLSMAGVTRNKVVFYV